MGRALDRADGMAVLHPVRSRGLSKLGSKTRERVGLEVAGSDLTGGREEGRWLIESRPGEVNGRLIQPFEISVRTPIDRILDRSSSILHPQASKHLGNNTIH